MDSIPPPRPNPLNITANHLSRAQSLLLQPPFPTPPSHSSSHSLRVHNIAIQLYSALPPCTRPKISVPLLRLLALLHDIADHKYLPSDLTSSSNFLRNLFETNLRLHPLVADYIASLCDNVSYSKQVNSAAIPTGQILELDLVRDADRLDAIGAIGIARCFSYGGERGHPLADQRSHFDDKVRQGSNPLISIAHLRNTVPCSCSITTQSANNRPRLLCAYHVPILRQVVQHTPAIAHRARKTSCQGARTSYDSVCKGF